MARNEAPGAPDPLWKVMVVALPMAFAMWAPLLAIPPIEGLLTVKMGLSHAQASWLFGGPVLMMSLVAIPGGFLADRLGVKRTTGVGGFIIVAANLLKATAGGYGELLLYSLVYGIGLGLSFPNLPKLVAHCTTRQRANFLMGIFTVSVLVSGALSLAATLPWIYPLTRSTGGVFLVWTCPAIVATILWWLFIKEPPCGVAPADAPRDWRTLRRVLRTRVLWLLSTVFVLHNFFLYAWAGWITLYLVTRGASPGLAGVIASVTLWVGIPSVLLATVFSSLSGKRKPFLWLPSLFMAIAALLAPAFTVGTSWALMAIVGASTTTRFNTILAMPIELVPMEQAGTASGLVISVGYTGALLGPLVCGRMLDVTGSFTEVFLVLAGVSLTTAALAVLLPETGGGRERPAAS